MSLRRKRERQHSFTPVKKIIKDDSLSQNQKIKSQESKKSNVSSINFPKIEKPKKFRKNKIKFLESIIIKLDNNINEIKSIGELHEKALEKYSSLKNIDDIDYKYVLDELIKIFDLDETINELFLKKLYEYYKKNKTSIDNSQTGISNEISHLFFNYIFTVNYKKRMEFYELFNFFGKNELFLATDKLYFYKEPMEKVFQKFIEGLLKISLTITNKEAIKSNDNYLKELSELYSHFQFPDYAFTVPVNFGSQELIYIDFILKLQLIFCVNDNDNNTYKKKFYKYSVTEKFLALNYFSQFLSIKKYDDIKSIQYIIFCLYSFFYYYNSGSYLLESTIKIQFFICSRFLYQEFEEKKKYLKEIKHLIKSDIDLDKITENFLETNALIIQYDNKEINIKINNCFCLGDNKAYLDDLMKGKAYNFNFLKSKKFPLFIDNDLNNDFNNHVKLFLQSNITKEYLNSLVDFPKIDGVIFTDKIIQEIADNTLWVRFPLENIHGLTDRENFTIFLNNNIEQNLEDNATSIFLSSRVITSGHEKSNHAVRLLLNCNGYKFTKTTPKKKDLYKINSFNKISENYEDQGDKWECILFGEKIRSMYLMGSLIILDSDNFGLTIREFKKKFKDNNKKFKLKEIDKKLNKIKKNKNNKLISNIKSFDKIEVDYWTENIQCMAARNLNFSEFCSSQSLPFGICGNHLENLYH